MAGRLSEWKPVHELIGQVLDNRFQVASFIREGGMAQIFCGVQDEEPRHVAIKVMHPHLADNPEVVARFLREAKVAARLDHPSIVKILTVGEEHSLLYMVMELIVGDDISEPIKERGFFSEARSAQIIIETCAALQHAHERGVVHRDIKPENIMLCRSHNPDEPETVKVLDFGIAKIFDDEKKAPLAHPEEETEAGVRSVLTRVGTMIGTPAYMSPEQGRADPVGPSSDIYSMGVLLYEMVTGHLPFQGATPVHVIARHVHDAVPLPSSHGVVHPGLEAVIMRALEKDPANRQPDAKTMADELRELLPELSAVAGASAAPIEAWLSRKPPAPEGPKLWTEEPLAALAETPVSQPPRARASLRPAPPSLPAPPAIPVLVTAILPISTPPSTASKERSKASLPPTPPAAPLPPEPPVSSRTRPKVDNPLGSSADCEVMAPKLVGPKASVRKPVPGTDLRVEKEETRDSESTTETADSLKVTSLMHREAPRAHDPIDRAVPVPPQSTRRVKPSLPTAPTPPTPPPPPSVLSVAPPAPGAAPSADPSLDVLFDDMSSAELDDPATLEKPIQVVIERQPDFGETTAPLVKPSPNAVRASAPPSPQRSEPSTPAPSSAPVASTAPPSSSVVPTAMLSSDQRKTSDAPPARLPAPTFDASEIANTPSARPAEVRRLTRLVNVLLAGLVITLTVVAVLIARLIIVR